MAELAATLHFPKQVLICCFYTPVFISPNSMSISSLRVVRIVASYGTEYKWRFCNECTVSHLITKFKQCWACLVLGWLQVSFFFLCIRLLAMCFLEGSMMAELVAVQFKVGCDLLPVHISVYFTLQRRRKMLEVGGAGCRRQRHRGAQRRSVRAKRGKFFRLHFSVIRMGSCGTFVFCTDAPGSML